VTHKNKYIYILSLPPRPIFDFNNL